MTDLAAQFARSWPGSMPAGLGDKLAQLCAAARAGNPTLALDDAALVAALASHIARDADPIAFCARCRAADFGLAVAATTGARLAIEELERRFAATIALACRRHATAGHAEDDLRQIVRAKLFVGPPAAIALYNGQGSLENWVRVIAARTLIDLRRRKDRVRELAVLDDARILAPADLALELIKAEYRAAITAALRDAARSLPPGDRHLLRQHLVFGLSIDQLGAMLGVHRATAARRIAQARAQLAARTRELVAERLELEVRELEQLLGLVISKLDLSMRTLLATPPADRA
jgi:RNA polymerase sigma-70 factor, ECF subfamily